MATFKVNVNKLNLRSNPVNDFEDKSNVVGVLHQDTTFEGVSEITNELGTWHGNRDGHWASGKWLGEAEPQIIPTIFIPNTEKNSDWMNLLGIAEVWKITKGKSVCVAVLDSGIDLNNKDITSQLYQYSNDCKLDDINVCKNFLTKTSDVNDVFGHGSHCASLISCSSENIIAIAPDSKLFIGKIDNTGGFDDFSKITEGILWASNIEEVDIISVSNGLSDPNLQDPTLPNLRSAFDFALSKNKIVIAAIGDKDNDPNPLYPALFTECISVGATDSFGSYWTGNVDSTSTKIFAPGETIYSNSNSGKFISLSGNSQSTAIVAGIIALILSYLKSKNIESTQKSITEIIEKYSSFTLNNPPKLLINPLKIFSNI